MAKVKRPAQPPALFWRLTEGRALLELGAFRLLQQRLRELPKGDGHPVLVLPGFLASDRSTRPMRDLFSDLGYQSFGWSLGRNLKFDAKRAEEMNTLLADIHADTQRKVSVVGWSLGGTYARELAKLQPEKVRQVISLGSPISGDRRHASSRRLFELFNGDMLSPNETDLATAPPVPTTSIFTLTDGVVAWRGSVQHPEAGRADLENIIVPASHLGLGVNPLVMLAIADRLAQKEGAWRAFERKGWRQRVFKTLPPEV